jgi:hypothetical protein
LDCVANSYHCRLYLHFLVTEKTDFLCFDSSREVEGNALFSDARFFDLSYCYPAGR